MWNEKIHAFTKHAIVKYPHVYCRKANYKTTINIFSLQEYTEVLNKQEAHVVLLVRFSPYPKLYIDG